MIPAQSSGASSSRAQGLREGIREGLGHDGTLRIAAVRIPSGEGGVRAEVLGVALAEATHAAGGPEPGDPDARTHAEAGTPRPRLQHPADHLMAWNHRITVRCAGPPRRRADPSGTRRRPRPESAARRNRGRARHARKLGAAGSRWGPASRGPWRACHQVAAGWSTGQFPPSAQGPPRRGGVQPGPGSSARCLALEPRPMCPSPHPWRHASGAGPCGCAPPDRAPPAAHPGWSDDPYRDDPPADPCRRHP